MDNGFKGNHLSLGFGAFVVQSDSLKYGVRSNCGSEFVLDSLLLLLFKWFSF